jgi:hypothetical protein
MSKFKYPCPYCGRSDFHASECDESHEDFDEYEMAYSGIISVLLGKNSIGEFTTLPKAISKDELKSEVSDMMETGAWRSVHEDCLDKLMSVDRVVYDDGFILVQPTEYEGVVPVFEPLSIVYEYGPIDGCKDYSVYSMVSWCTFIDMDWDQTVNFMKTWLEDTGRWESESWKESNLTSLIKSKKHVHSTELAWGDYPEVAQQTMEDSEREPKIDSGVKNKEYSLEDFD